MHPYAKYEYRGDDRGGCLPGGAGLAFLVLACLGCGRRAGTDGVRLLWMDYIPLELHTAIIAAAIAGLGVVLFGNLFNDLSNYYGYLLSTLYYGGMFLAACGALGAVAGDCMQS